MATKAELEGEMGDSHMGLQARLMSQAMRKLTGIIGKTNCVAVFINQIREKLGVSFGSPETTTGGRALKYFATVRIDVRKSEAIKDGNEIIGNVTRCKVVKNKVAPPFKECCFDLLYGEGTSYEGELIDLGSALGVLVKSGSWYSFKGEKIGQGKERVRLFLKEHPELCKDIEALIRQYKDRISFVPGKGAKPPVIEVKKGAQVTWDGNAFVAGEVDGSDTASVSSADDEDEEELPLPVDDGDVPLTDFDLDVDADLEDFGE